MKLNPRSVLKNLTRPVGIFSCSSQISVINSRPSPSFERPGENLHVHNSTAALAAKPWARIISVTPSRGSDNGTRRGEVVQSDQGLWIYSAAGRREGCIRPHLRGRARWTYHA